MTDGMWSMLMVKVRETMGIVGIEVVQNRQVTMISLYKQTLMEIKVVPEEEGYHKAMESFANHPHRACDVGVMAI
ncbi:hypothetical protein KSP39_PZI002043 [Platanthera zijinensis]|uniref:Uncharacterized protein n=1 Tax=Platanthera zijinensis TaxID=2320716 RepID=A0AAP0GEG7_9ASPA